MKVGKFNLSSPELIAENIAKKPTEYLQQPKEYNRLKRAQDALEDQRLQRELDNEFDIGEDDE